MKVTLTESAVRDLEEIAAYYKEQGAPKAGTKLIKGILGRISSLGKNPDIGRMVPEFENPGLRELIFPPFRIVYRCESKLVRVVRVWRSERLLKLPKE